MQRTVITMSRVKLAVKTHAATMRLSSHELAQELVDQLGPTLVAALAKVRDRKLPHKWASDGGPVPRPESLARLQVAHRAWVTIAAAESDDIARAWFIGANPHLDEIPPYLAIRDGRYDTVMAAAAAFVEGA